MTIRTEPTSSPAPTLAAPPSDPLVGRRVHKYEIVRVIGRGGMGTVYEALNTAIGKRVAMKFIDASTVQNSDAVARFHREAEAASAVESAHIVDIFDSGISEEGQPFIVMELLRGEDLGHRIKRCGRLDLPEAVHVTAQILRGLHRAHKAGIVHRDLKPDNIFLVDRDDDPNFAKILDFGISKVRRQGDTPVHTLTRQGTVLGTPFYMSPEQAQAQPDVDARSDLWSVGAILYECLTGRPPYTGSSYEQVIVNICMNDADDVRLHNPAVPEPVAAVIARALSRDREGRFENARAFLDALRLAAGGLPASRGGSLAGDDSYPGARSSDPALMPVSSGRTPSTGRRKSPASDDPALDSTVQFHSTPPGDENRSPSLITRRRAAAAAQRRMFVLVAVSALLVGGLGAFLVARTWVRPPRSVEIQSPSVTQGEGPGSPETPGSVQAGATSIHPAVPGSTPLILPAPDLTATAVEPAVPPVVEPVKVQKVEHVGGPLPPVSVKAVPRPPETAVPVAPGIAPGLKLKTE